FSADPAAFFAWSQPGLDIAHMVQPCKAIDRTFRRWLGENAGGRSDHNQRLTPARLHLGNSLAPPPGNTN
ncbi:MAG TPA: hypothetical protein VF258_02630, partial [Luteolibacter sp.]